MVFENRVLGILFWLKRKGVNRRLGRCIARRFIACIPHWILFAWDGRTAWHVLWRRETRTEILLRNLEERDHSEDLGSDVRVILKTFLKNEVFSNSHCISLTLFFRSLISTFKLLFVISHSSKFILQPVLALCYLYRRGQLLSKSLYILGPTNKSLIQQAPCLRLCIILEDFFYTYSYFHSRIYLVMIRLNDIFYSTNPCN